MPRWAADRVVLPRKVWLLSRRLPACMPPRGGRSIGMRVAPSAPTEPIEWARLGRSRNGATMPRCTSCMKDLPDYPARSRCDGCGAWLTVDGGPVWTAPVRQLSAPPKAPTGARVDFDELLRMTSPLPPPTAPARPKPLSELDFGDDQPTPRRLSTTSNRVPSIQPVALHKEDSANEKNERHQPARPNAMRAGAAFVCVVSMSAALAIGLRPRTPQEVGIRGGLAPAASFVRNLAPGAPPQVAAPEDAPPTISVPRDAPLGTPEASSAPDRSAPAKLPSNKFRDDRVAASKPTDTKPHDTAKAKDSEAESGSSTAADAPPPFDRDSARAALAGPTAAAAGCFEPGADESAHVSVTFNPNGHSTQAVVSGGTYGGTSVGSCIAAAFRGVSVAPFDGPPVTVATSIHPPVPKATTSQ
jgi:hypothetical protein